MTDSPKLAADSGDVDSNDPEVVLVDGRKLTFENLTPRQSWAALARVHLQQANFQRRNYAGFELAGLDLRHSNLAACDFAGANLSAVNLDNANLDSALFVSAKMQAAELGTTNLPDTDFSSADLRGATFINCNAFGAIFDKAKLRKAKFTHKSRFAFTSFEYADLRYAELNEVDFSGACLDNADLSHAVIKEADFTGASLCGAKLHHTVLGNAIFANADLSNVDFDFLSRLSVGAYSDFTGMKLNGARNVPEDFHQWGVLNELQPLLRRVPQPLLRTSEVGLDHVTTGLRKLWLDRAVSGVDFLLEPLDELMDAAYAIAIAIAPKNKSRF